MSSPLPQSSSSSIVIPPVPLSRSMPNSMSSTSGSQPPSSWSSAQREEKHERERGGAGGTGTLTPTPLPLTVQHEHGLLVALRVHARPVRLACLLLPLGRGVVGDARKVPPGRRVGLRPVIKASVRVPVVVTEPREHRRGGVGRHDRRRRASGDCEGKGSEGFRTTRALARFHAPACVRHLM